MSGLDHGLEPDVEVRRFEVINGAMGRRRWSADDRAQILEASLVQYRKLHELHNGDIVSTCDSQGPWIAIVYGPSKKKGWVHGKWLKELAG